VLKIRFARILRFPAGTASASVAPLPSRYRDLQTRAVPAGVFVFCLGFVENYPRF